MERWEVMTTAYSYRFSLYGEAPLATASFEISAQAQWSSQMGGWTYQAILTES
jgi:hypothetical protein